MVKSVVKPLKMGFLRERIVPKKSVFTRAFGVFCFEMPLGRCPAPKPGALPTALHPEIVRVIFCCSCPLRFLPPLPHHATLKLAFCDGWHSLLLAASAPGGARKRPQLRYIPREYRGSCLPRYYSKRGLCCQVLPQSLSQKDLTIFFLLCYTE